MEILKYRKLNRNKNLIFSWLLKGKLISIKEFTILYVPIRDMETHALLPGVLAGDIGPKIGFNSMDNGFLQLDHVRIPRDNMCMRFQEVDENGIYSKVGSGSGNQNMTDKIAYITMMQVRAFIILHCGSELSKAATIGIRYACIRRQGEKDKHYKNSLERKSKLSGSAKDTPSTAFNRDLENVHEQQQNEMLVIDYTIQQYRLFPMLAASFAFLFAGKQLLSNIRFLTYFVSMNAKSSSVVKDRSLGNNDSGIFIKTKMQELHVALSGLKCLSSTMACSGMEDIRRSCGGHGYLLASGLPEMINTFLQQCTVEGDNYLLTQQVVGYLLKVIIQYESELEEDEEDTSNKNKTEATINDYCSYLKTCRAAKVDGGNDQSHRKQPQNSESTVDTLSTTLLLSLFEDRVYLLLKRLKTSLQEMILPMEDPTESDDSNNKDQSPIKTEDVDLDVDLVKNKKLENQNSIKDFYSH